MHRIDVAVQDYVATVDDPELRQISESFARVLADSFLAAGTHEYWPYHWLPLRRYRIAQALHAYNTCLAGLDESAALVASDMYRRDEKFRYPFWLSTNGTATRAANRQAYRQVAWTVCMVTDEPAAWRDLAALDQLLNDDDASPMGRETWSGFDFDDFEIAGPVEEQVLRFGGSLDDHARSMLARFIRTVAVDSVDESDADGWQPFVQEALRLYLSLLASGVSMSVQLTRRDSLAVPDQHNAFPSGLDVPVSWDAVRTWKFRPSQHLQDLVARGDRGGVKRYVAAADHLMREVEERTRTESPSVDTADFDIFRDLLDAWGDSSGPVDLARHLIEWHELMWSVGGPFNPAPLESDDPAVAIVDAPAVVDASSEVADTPSVVPDTERLARLEELVRSEHERTRHELAALRGEVSDLELELGGLELQLRQAESTIGQLRTALAEQSVRVDTQSARADAAMTSDRAAGLALAQRVGEVEERFESVSRTTAVTPTTPPAPVDTAAPPAEPDPAGQRAHALDSLQLHAVNAFLRSMGAAPARLVALPTGGTVSRLRAFLPSRLAVAPNGSGEDASVVLVYQCHGTPRVDADSRLADLLVDLSAMLAPSGLLDRPLCERLKHLLPRLTFVSPAMREHVIARAQWRRAVPATGEDLDLSRPVDVRAYFATLLEELVDGRPHLALGLSRLRTVLHASAPSSTPAPQRAPAPPTVPVPPPAPPSTSAAPTRFSEPSAELRRATEMAQRTLADLDIEDTDSSRPPEPIGQAGPDRLRGPMRELAEWLSAAEQHDLGEARKHADGLGLIPLNAFLDLNEWAQQRCEALGRDIDAVIRNDTKLVYVDHAMKELLA